MPQSAWFSVLLLTGCIPLAAGPNHFTPAGEFRENSGSFTVSAELAPIYTLSGESLLEQAPVEGEPFPAFFVADIGYRHGVTDRLLVEGELKWAAVVPLPLPLPVGLGLGARYTLLRQAEAGISLDAGLRLTVLSASATVNTGAQETQHSASAWGATAYAVTSWRATSWLALSLSPFVRAFSVSTRIEGDGAPKITSNGVLGLGASLAVELKLGVIVLSPALALEGVGSRRGFEWALPAPGLAVGGRW